MSKKKTSYPLDEFDPTPGAVKRNGVHRAGKSAWSGIWPFFLVLLLAVGLGFGTIYALMQSPDSKVNEIINEATGTDSTSSGDASPSEDGETAGDEGSAEPESTEESPAEEETTEPAPEETTEEAPESTVDYSVSVRVLNAGSTQGAAATAASQLTSDGFTAVVADNFEGEKPNAAVIYFLGAENKASAERIGEVLGISNVVEVTDLRADVSVVLR